jgi:hypothetical protein
VVAGSLTPTSSATVLRGILRVAVALGVSLLLASLFLRWTNTVNRWVRTDLQSANGDHLGARLTLEADGSVQGWLRSSTPSLAITCTPAGVEIAVVTGLPAAVEPGSGRTVRLRWDRSEAGITSWIQSANRQTLSAPPADVEALLARLAESGRLYFAYVPFNADPVEAAFTLAGFAAIWRESPGCQRKSGEIGTTDGSDENGLFRPAPGQDAPARTRQAVDGVTLLRG